MSTGQEVNINVYYRKRYRIEIHRRYVLEIYIHITQAVLFIQH